MIEMIVYDTLVKARIPTGQPIIADHRIILLKERNRERMLPIWVGAWEADMIAFQLMEKSFLRPLTFEFMAQMLEASQMVVERVAVSKLHENIYYSTVWVRTPDGKVQEIDARPSDAIALALHVKAPIWAEEAMLEKAGVEPEKLQTHLYPPKEGKVETEAPEMEWYSQTSRALAFSFLHPLPPIRWEGGHWWVDEAAQAAQKE